MNNSIKISPLIVFIIFYCLLGSAGASVVLWYSFWIEFAATVVCFLYFNSRKAPQWTNTTVWASVILIIAVFYTYRGGNLANYIGKFMGVSLAIILINLKDEWRIKLLESISKWFAVLLIISTVAWLLHFFMPLPHTIIAEEDTNGFTGRYIYNYFLFKEFDAFSLDDPLRRFQSVFKEPGHLGTIVVFFLVANRFDLKKKWNLMFLLCAILSFSASAYFLLALGYLLFRFFDSGNKRFLVSALIVAGLVVFFINYNGGNNAVNTLIFGKLTREEGAMQSRTSLELVGLYEQMWSSGTDLLFGKRGYSDIEFTGAGFILFFVQNGLVGTILLILSYFSIFWSRKSKYGFIIFIIYIVSFLQRTYPFWDAFLFPYILGLSYAKCGRHLLDNTIRVNK